MFKIKKFGTISENEKGELVIEGFSFESVGEAVTLKNGETITYVTIAIPLIIERLKQALETIK
jgi:hypothetical protein